MLELVLVRGGDQGVLVRERGLHWLLEEVGHGVGRCVEIAH